MIRLTAFIFGLFMLGWATGMGCAPKSLPPGIENAAAVAQYDAALTEARCKEKGKAAKSLDVYDACEAEVIRHVCSESEALRRAWSRCNGGSDGHR